MNTRKAGLKNVSSRINLPVQQKFRKSGVRVDAELRFYCAPPPRLIPDIYPRQLP